MNNRNNFGYLGWCHSSDIFPCERFNLNFQRDVQVGTKFGQSTFGKLLSDSQVGRFKDKSAAAISTFGNMFPKQAAGLFSSLGSAMKHDSRDTVYY